MDFDSVLEDVLLVRGQANLKLKQKQKEALQAVVVNGQDCLIVLPTGYGKSLIYQMLALPFDKTNLSLNVTSEGKSIVIVVSPLNALIDDLINKLCSVGVACTSLRVCGADIEERIFAIDDLQTGKFELIFTHPQVAVSNRQCRDLFLSTYYQRICLVLRLVLLQVNACFFSSTDSILQLQVHVYLIKLCGVGLHNTKVDIVILTLIF